MWGQGDFNPVLMETKHGGKMAGARATAIYLQIAASEK